MTEKIAEKPSSTNNEIEKPLRGRVFKAGAWLFALRILGQVFRIARLVILARLLAPDDFGLMGIAMLALTTMETFSQTGLQVAMIQRKDDISEYLDTSWTCAVIRGFLLFVLIFITAPWVGNFFETPKAIPIIQTVGVLSLIRGLTNPATVNFIRKLDFKKQFAMEIAGTLGDFIFVTGIAFLTRNVWALVAGLLGGGIARLIASYWVQPYFPSFNFEKKRFLELFGFGKFVFFQTIVLFFINQADGAFVGKIIGITELGFYQYAKRISNLPATEITHVLSQVTFPAYAKLQNEKVRLGQALLRTLEITAFVSLPIAMLLLVLAPLITTCVFGEQWIPMIPAMQILCIFCGIRVLAASFGPAYRAIARLDIPLSISLLQLLVMALLFFPLSTRYGICGTAMAVVIGGIQTFILSSIGIVYVLKFNMQQLVKTWIYPLMACFGMAGVIYFLQNYLLTLPQLVELIILSIIAVGVYLAQIILIFPYLGYRIPVEIQNLLNKYLGWKPYATN